MIAHACHFPGGEVSIHDTEREAMSRAAWLMSSKTATVAVHYRVVIEPAVRVAGYWDRAREAA